MVDHRIRDTAYGWLRESLEWEGYPTPRVPHYRKGIQYGLLKIVGTNKKTAGTAAEKLKEFMNPPQGQAAAVIFRASDPPDIEGGHHRVIMTLESFLQIVLWLLESNPDEFLNRELTPPAKDKDE